MNTLMFVAATFVPPLIGGPVPAVLWFNLVSGLRWRRWLPLVIPSAILLNLIAGAVIIANLDGFLPPGFIACMLTPFVALATLIVALWHYRRIDLGPDANPAQRLWLRVGLVAVPVLQMLTVAIAVLVAPAFCNTLIRNCSPWP